ncbi:hypothetical protein ACWV16_07345 [Achromobacter xylosoxidans]
MNIALERLARQLDLDAPRNETLRLAFGHACARRVEHLLEDPQAMECLANHHPGSTSIDGCGHAAVSATYAVASALAGKALRAAEYAAYAAVYGQGGHGAVSDPASFDIEHAWQADCLERCALPA